MRTGFTNAFPNKPLKKYYSYHGILMPCYIQPDPEPFASYEIKPGGGPIVTKTFLDIIFVNREQNGLDYQEVHDSLAGAEYTRYVGQLRWDLGGGWSDFWIGRVFVGWNTSIIPDNATILSAKIIANIEGLKKDSPFSVTIRNGMPIYPHIPVVDSDYFFGNYSGDSGSTFVEVVGLYEIDLNAEGLKKINKTGQTKFALLSDRDILSLPPYAPESFEYCTFKIGCKLQVTYQEAA